MKWPLAKGNEKKNTKTMMGSKDSHDTEVLNCQQQCDNDAIKSSCKEEPGEQQRLCALHTHMHGE